MKKITLFILVLFFTVFTVNSQISLVKDLVTTDSDSYPYNFLNATNFTVFTVFVNGQTQVWASDGTEANTVNIAANINDIFNVQSHSIVYNNHLYFVIENGNEGSELYKTDGTLNGTQIVKDINPGFGSDPRDFIIFNNELYFTAYDGTASNLWKTDGTEIGTVKISDKVQSLSGLIIFNNELYFSGEDNSFISQLWKTDGTDAGTMIVKTINTTGSARPADFIIANNTLFFSAEDDTNGVELWKTDGTEMGTVLVKNINPGINSSTPSFKTVLNNQLLFIADDVVKGNELWKTDGTDAGTVLVKDIETGNASITVNDIYKLNNTIALLVAKTATHGYELWKTDGTTVNTTLIKDINPGADSGFNVFSQTTPVLVNNILYFDGNDGTNGSELWKTDGTNAGTVMVKNINTDNNIESGNGLVTGLVALNNNIVFEAFDTTHNREMWISDGSEAGTTIIKDANPGIGWGAYVETKKAVNNQVFFIGSNGINGFELWKTNGTEAGTNMVKNIEYKPSGSNPLKLTTALGKVFFVADSTQFGGQRLFLTDGTTLGTKKVTSGLKSVVGPSNLIEYNNNLYFTSQDFMTDYGIFYTNPNGDQINFVGKVNANGFANIDEFFKSTALDALFFGANDGTNGKELWMLKNNQLNFVKDLVAGSSDGNPENFIEFNGEVYFMSTIQGGNAFNRTYKKVLWKTDGTENGTLKLHEFDFTSFNINPYFTVYKNKLYFTAFDTSLAGSFLWLTDGTVNGTMVENVAASFPQSMFVFGDNMYFAGENFAEGRELWKYDGTNATMLKSFVNGASNGYQPLNNFNKVVNGYYYFSVFENGTNSLWSFDGTDTGFIKLMDYQFIDAVFDAGNVVYLSLDDATNGTELWKSDGTINGTVMVQDFYSGQDSFQTPNSSRPNEFASLNGDLLFAADSELYSRELFKLENAVLSTDIEIIASSDFKISLYPNPTLNTFKIASEKNINTIEIYNLLGKKVAPININLSNKTFDVANLSKGLYLIKIKIDNEIISKKIIKK